MMRRSATAPYATPRKALDSFDYGAPAEMFMTRARMMRGRPPIAYRRFASAAQAIQYAVEGLAPSLLVGAVMEVAENRFDHQAIRELYAREDYPLPRD